jgi:acetoin utilization protein AcuB
MIDPSGVRFGLVRDWMTRVPTMVGPDCPIETALQAMHRTEIRHLLVVDAGRLVGIVSSRDWRRIDPRTLAGGEQPITHIMSEDPVTVAPETPVTVAARVLLERRIGCLPVRDDETIIGIFTRSDALDALLSALE